MIIDLLSIILCFFLLMSYSMIGGFFVFVLFFPFPISQFSIFTFPLIHFSLLFNPILVRMNVDRILDGVNLQLNQDHARPKRVWLG